jgi:hypothetical protein
LRKRIRLGRKGRVREGRKKEEEGRTSEEGRGEGKRLRKNRVGRGNGRENE